MIPCVAGERGLLLLSHKALVAVMRQDSDSFHLANLFHVYDNKLSFFSSIFDNGGLD